MMSRKLAKLALALGLIVVWTLDLMPITPATAQTPFLASPYYGTTTISQGYSPSHQAYDFSFTIGNRVLAAAGGTVTVAGWYNNPQYPNPWNTQNPPNSCHEYRLRPGDPGYDPARAQQCGCGLYVKIAHSSGYETTYCHLSAITVQVGQSLPRGQMIGTTGNTGWSTGPHLHFAVRLNNSPVDPFNPNLWSDGQWAGSPLVAPVPDGTAVSIDDTPDNTGGFKKGRISGSSWLECPPNSCPYWYRVTGIGIGSDMYYTYVNGTAVDYWANWWPNLSQERRYEVQVHIPCNHATSWYAPYYIFSTGYHSSYARVDQLGLCNQWISLGYYNLRSGSNTYIRTFDATTEPYSTGRKVGVDAVRFQPVR